MKVAFRNRIYPLIASDLIHSIFIFPLFELTKVCESASHNIGNYTTLLFSVNIKPHQIEILPQDNEQNGSDVKKLVAHGKYSPQNISSRYKFLCFLYLCPDKMVC